ncbi:MAG: Helicase associated domain protein [Actinomycetota bacterium]
MASVEELLSRLSDDRNIRGDQFERICRWFLTSDPVYRRKVRRVRLWKDWPGRSGRDLGIDLVAETCDGSLWAIQAKAYQQDEWISKRDIDSFLTASARREFAFRLLIGTTNHVGRNAWDMIKAQEKPVGRVLLADLERSAVDWPSSPERLYARHPQRKKPFPHNRQAISAVAKGFRESARGQVIMACGTGKTLVGLWVAERLESRRTLVLVPSLSLLSQTLREWTHNSARDFSYLAVCSDDTVRGQDDFMSRTADLGLPATTDPDEIASFLRKRSVSVIFATYHSSPQIAAAFNRNRVPWFDLAIADEAHRCVGLVRGDFATILDGGRILARRRLFMTATPKYFTNRIRREAGEAELEVASMDDEDVFGPAFHTLGFSEAIDRKLLSDYRVLIVGVDDDTWKEYARTGRFIVLGDEEIKDARTVALQLGVIKAMRRYSLRRVVSFHGRVANARRFATSLPSVFNWLPPRKRPRGVLWTRYISGEMPSGDRDVILGGFRDLGALERGVLSNARCLTEGVDVPSIDGVAFVDPRRSQIDIVQAVGRAIRRAEEKTHGTVVLPVFASRWDNADDALIQSVFKPVWDVLKALRAHDDSLAEELDELRRSLGRRGTTGRTPRKIEIDLPTSVTPEFADAFHVRLVENTTSEWEFMFGLLARFVAREGHSRVPSMHLEANRRLGTWVAWQRRLFKRGELLPDRIERLNSLPKWAWDAVAAEWDEGLGHLVHYIERKGDAYVPATFIDDDGFPLGSWVHNQRVFHRKGPLSEERVSRLEQLPHWVWDVRAEAWRDGRARLAGYAKRHGNALVPRAHIEPDGFALGAWVINQRARRVKGTLTKEQISELSSVVGWQWNARDARWEEGYVALERFARREGHADVPKGWMEDSFPLGTWVSNVRRRDRVRPERVTRLERITGWTWHAKNAAWERGFIALERFANREGHASPPRDWVENGVELRAWVNNARHRDRDDPERAPRLDQIKGWVWNANDAAWETGLRALTRYVQRYGDARVPRDHEQDGVRLGRWLSNTRARARRNELKPDRLRCLRALGVEGL